jgi:hypothetical protein
MRLRCGPLPFALTDIWLKGEFGYRLDEHEDILSESLTDILPSVESAVLKHVVDKCGDDGVIVYLKVYEEMSNGNRMLDVGLAGSSKLALVRIFSDIVGKTNLANIGVVPLSPEAL